MTEVNSITGEVQNIRKDKKALQINNEWYNSKFKVLDNVNKGDKINLQYKENKGFKNIVNYYIDIEPLETINHSNNYELKLPTPKETINTLVMQSITHSNNLKLNLIDATKDVVNSYKYIIENI